MAKGVMGRPTAGGPVVVVEVDGRRAGWVDGQLVGDKGLRYFSAIAAYCGSKVTLTVPTPEGTRKELVVSDLNTAAGAIAAMCAYAPSRATILKGSEHVSR